ncbi:hypothetical protein MSHOH_1574 [Methanosarcina horonobensis HB-1 = JCM 15518]|uniref:Uncharacterized protein n=1 Tax=Methanosarcina horonobensis HB-1 = JCM 15518 TaxID=1434110 RepID=A0A0E3SD99_9EURY|nr:hypothetical protein MSHOH_1574 [Methanosarcina horonobensis HB-1 = JCM 15518]
MSLVYTFITLSSVYLFLRKRRRKNKFQGTGLLFFVLTAALLFIPRVFKSRKVKSKGDLTGITLNPLRVQTAQLMAFLSVSLPAVMQGWSGIENLMPYGGQF